MIEEPERVRHLFSAADAERTLHIRASTIRSWARRGELYAAGLDERKRPLYDRDHLRHLAG